MEPTNPADATPGADDDGIGGWISPDGTFFQAHCTCHFNVAVDIIGGYLAIPYYGCISGYLEEQGWIRLETDGQIHHAYNPTPGQIDVLYYLYIRGGNWFYNAHMYTHVRPIPETSQAREPVQRVPSQGDQENYRCPQTSY